MKFVCAQTELNNALHLVSRAVSARPSHPVLANVLLTADAGTGKLSLTGFDLSLGIQTSIPASVESSGAVTLPARLFGEIVSRLSADSPITLSSGDGSEQVEITSVSGSYQMRGLAAEDYPVLPLDQKGAPVAINRDALIEGLEQTLFATSNDESKQILTGINLSLNSKQLTCAATDGHRLAVQHTGHSGVSDEEFTVTIPAKSMRELERLLGGSDMESVSIYHERGQLVAISGEQVLTTRTLDGTYPNYEGLIPKKFYREISVNRRGLIAALDRVAVLADQHNNVVQLAADGERGEVLVQADAQDVGRGSEVIAGKVKGDDIEIAFNVRYLLDGLKAISSDEVTIFCNTATTPAVLKGEDAGFMYLVMPIQVRK